MAKIHYNDKGHLVMEDVELGRGGFRNFEGKKTQFNPFGKRTFVILLDENDGMRIQNDGWYVRWREPRDEQDDRKALMTAEIRFDKYRPKIVLISSGVMTDLDESNLEILDTAEIRLCDVVLSPFTWTSKETGKEWFKGFVKTMYVTLAEDDFEGKYAR